MKLFAVIVMFLFPVSQVFSADIAEVTRENNRVEARVKLENGMGILAVCESSGHLTITASIWVPASFAASELSVRVFGFYEHRKEDGVLRLRFENGSSFETKPGFLLVGSTGGSSNWPILSKSNIDVVTLFPGEGTNRLILKEGMPTVFAKWEERSEGSPRSNTSLSIQIFRDFNALRGAMDAISAESSVIQPLLAPES